MQTVRKAISLTDKQDPWIKTQIDAGHYTDDSEIEAIRAALIEGEASGEPESFDAAEFKRRMLATHG